jgi:hypothetical protein
LGFPISFTTSVVNTERSDMTALCAHGVYFAK